MLRQRGYARGTTVVATVHPASVIDLFVSGSLHIEVGLQRRDVTLLIYIRERSILTRS